MSARISIDKENALLSDHGSECAMTVASISRSRKSRFVKLFDKTPNGVRCPHFYELVLSNGCPYDCSYCYLKLTFRGDKTPILFENEWCQVERELEAVPKGVFATGELADSLAVEPPLLRSAIEYFTRQNARTLLLLTKSTNIQTLLEFPPSRCVIASFSVNSLRAAQRYEAAAPPPVERLKAAQRLKDAGYRVRIRLDPIILEAGLDDYRDICHRIACLAPEMVTVGSLRQFPGLIRFAPSSPRAGLRRAPDGRLRYSVEERIKAYELIANWLGFQPTLCKETEEVWSRTGWAFYGCNCTGGEPHN